MAQSFRELIDEAEILSGEVRKMFFGILASPEGRESRQASSNCELRTMNSELQRS